METIAVSDSSTSEKKDSDFDRFLVFANKKTEPQCICAVVCEAIPLESGNGMSFKPVTCIDKPLQSIKQFNDLVMAGSLTGHDWDLMCMSMLMGENGQIATAIETNKRLDVMLAFLRQGQADKMIIFDRKERHVKL